MIVTGRVPWLAWLAFYSGGPDSRLWKSDEPLQRDAFGVELLGISVNGVRCQAAFPATASYIVRCWRTLNRKGEWRNFTGSTEKWRK